MYREHLSRALKIIFREESSFDELRTAVRAMHRICSEITGIRGAIRNRSEGYETRISSGLALSPGHAADCTLDTHRTVRYIRALDQAVKTQLTRFPGEQLHILYAGTGPFAPFAIALCHRYTPDEIQFTALDLHLQSIEALQVLTDALRLTNWFHAYTQCDATEYEHIETHPLHIVVTETMHRTISREPQTAITLNLAPQLVEGGIFIPERVTISAAMSNLETELSFLRGKIDKFAIQNARVAMGPVFQLTKDYQPEFSDDANHLICGVKKVPEFPAQHNEMVLSTHIRLYGDICIEERESAITHPCFLRDFEPLHPGDTIQFQFRLTGMPELSCLKMVNKDIYSELEKLNVSV